jgi:uncharacterized protein
MNVRGYLASTRPYLVTLAWAIAAFVAGQVVATAVLLWWWHGDIHALAAAPYDGASVTLSVLILNPVTVGVLLLAVRFQRKDPAEYLALVWPQLRFLTIGIVGILVIIGATDAVLFATGRAVVSPFQTVSYTSAATEGWLVPMWLATVVVAPAGEEIMFRGYLFRGFVRTDRSAVPAIIVISLLWAAPHQQYDWTGMTEIFVAGLFLGWIRWGSGSTLLTFFLHALFNLEGMLETVVQVKHLL